MASTRCCVFSFINVKWGLTGLWKYENLTEIVLLKSYAWQSLLSTKQTSNKIGVLMVMFSCVTNVSWEGGVFSFCIKGTGTLLPISYLALLDGNDEVFSSFHIVLFILELTYIHSCDLKSSKKKVHLHDNSVIFNKCICMIGFRVWLFGRQTHSIKISLSSLKHLFPH